MDKIYDGKKEEKLGTLKNPAKIIVESEERKQEVMAVLKENGWEGTIEIQKGQKEDTGDLDMLLNKPDPVKVEAKIGRNDPCSCGSGKKYKKCCGK